MRGACLLVLLVIARGALAGAADVRLQLLDLDRDGYVSLAEAAGIDDVVEKFDRADADRDGRLSAREFSRLEKMKLRVARTARQHIRTAVARDARAARHEKTLEASTGAAAAGAGARPASP